MNGKCHGKGMGNAGKYMVNPAKVLCASHVCILYRHCDQSFRGQDRLGISESFFMPFRSKASEHGVKRAEFIHYQLSCREALHPMILMATHSCRDKKRSCMREETKTKLDIRAVVTRTIYQGEQGMRGLEGS